MNKLLPAFLAGLLVFNLHTAKSQIPETMDNSGSLNIYILNGWRFLNFSQLNEQLNTYGIPQVSTTQTGFGCGGYGSIGKLIIGGEGGTISTSAFSDTISTRADGGLGMFYVGYKVFQYNHFEIYPLTGVGLGGLTVTMTQKQNDMSFTNFLAAPLNSAKIGIGSFFYNISLAIDYRMKEKNTLFAGLRSGYNFAGASEWKADNFYFVNAPKDKFANFYLQLILGISIGG